MTVPQRAVSTLLFLLAVANGSCFAAPDGRSPAVLTLSCTVEETGEILIVEVPFDSITTNSTATGVWYLTLKLTSDSAHAFADLTTRNVGATLGVAFAGKALAESRILEPVYGGKLMIGTRSKAESEELVRQFAAFGK